MHEEVNALRSPNLASPPPSGEAEWPTGEVLGVALCMLLVGVLDLARPTSSLEEWVGAAAFVAICLSVVWLDKRCLPGRQGSADTPGPLSSQPRGA